MNLSLTAPVTPRSESLAFLSLSPNDLDCIEEGMKAPRTIRNAAHCGTPKAATLTRDDQAKIALCAHIKTLSESKSADEFVARRERLFAPYVDLMLGLGRIVHALTERSELVRKVKTQLAAGEKFFSGADEHVCPAFLKDQALFSLWELGKVVDLADFIHSRPPLPEAKREEDMRLSGICTTELLFGRIHLDCLTYAISVKHVHPDEIRELLSEGMRHFVNGHIAIRFGARLRQESEQEASVDLLPLDDEDRQHIAYSMAGLEDEEY